MPDSSDPAAKAALILLLQMAHAGELAAARAYRGHAASWWARRERAEIQAIEADEWRHRRDAGRMLAELGGRPQPWREGRMWLIGSTIGLLCHPGGWLVPMLGAAVLERSNVDQYETAARLARLAGYPAFVPCLLEMAETEWDHQAWFLAQVESHWLGRRLPFLLNPAAKLSPRETIRSQFDSWCAEAARVKV